MVQMFLYRAANLAQFKIIKTEGSKPFGFFVLRSHFKLASLPLQPYVAPYELEHR